MARPPGRGNYISGNEYRQQAFCRYGRGGRAMARPYSSRSPKSIKKSRLGGLRRDLLLWEWDLELNLGGLVALALDEDAVGGAVYADALEVEVLDGSVGVLSLDGVDA